MVEKWTLNSRATALVDIPAVSMPIARSLKACDICGIVLCDKTVRLMDYLGKGEVLTNTDFRQICEQYLREIGLLCT